MALAVAGLDADDQAIDRRQRPLHLQPAQATPSRRVRAAGILDHQTLVAARPGLGEDPIQAFNRIRRHQMRQRERSPIDCLRQLKRLEAGAPFHKRLLQDRFDRGIALPGRTWPHREQVEGDVDHRHLCEHLGSRVLSTQSRLKSQERQHPPVGVGKDLAVQDTVPTGVARSVHDPGALIPSYLSSTQTCGPRRARVSAASSDGEASMNRSGCMRRSRASPSRPSLASTAVSPMSPVSMPAQLTADCGLSKACAIAASRRPSRSPMRNSPLRILTTYLACRGSHRPRTAAKTATLAAGPGAASIASNASASSRIVGAAWGSGWTIRNDRTSATAVPRSDDRSYASPRAPAGALARLLTAAAMVAQPNPTAR